MVEVGYVFISGLFGWLVGVHLVIWLNGRLIRELSELVKTQNDLLTAMAKAELETRP